MGSIQMQTRSMRSDMAGRTGSGPACKGMETASKVTNARMANPSWFETASPTKKLAKKATAHPPQGELRCHREEQEPDGLAQDPAIEEGKSSDGERRGHGDEDLPARGWRRSRPARDVREEEGDGEAGEESLHLRQRVEAR